MKITRNNEPQLCKPTPKGEVLRKAAERYPDVDPEAIEVFLSIQRVAQEENARTQQVLENYGLSEGRFFVLTHLFSEEIMEHRNPSPSEIADSLGVTRATITGLLDGLERDNYLKRRHDDQDRRALTIQLTDKARDFLDIAIPQHSRHLKMKMAGLDANEKQTLIALLAKIQS